MLLRRTLPFLIFIFLLPLVSSAQTALIKGKITDEHDQPVQGAVVRIDDTQFNTLTDSSGSFEFRDVPFAKYNLSVQSGGLFPVTIPVDANSAEVTVAGLKMTHEIVAAPADEIPTAVLTESEINDGGSTGDVSGVLGASRNAFTDAITYTFSIARFRLRGYENGNAPTLINGVEMTDLVSNREMFFTWSGLNDVFRVRENAYGLEPNYNSFGGIGGSTSIDSRAARQRKQLQASYSVSNKTYDNRFMITYGSGVMKGGWSVAGSLSRRWAEEGYVDGTFYDSWAYFGSVEKDFGTMHSLSFTFYGSPLKSGRQAPATQEMYDIANSNFYNPIWGYQNGKRRNASVGRSHVPVFILSHEWKINNTSTLSTSLSYLGGKGKVSGLDWFNATDPRPDFYRRLPSFIALEDSGAAAAAYNLLSSTIGERQIKWDELYQSNYLSDSTLYNANGIDGDTVHGRWANYLVEDRVGQIHSEGFNTVYNKTVNENTNFTAGLSYRHQRSEFYKEVNDLLGADFYVDLNQYAEQSNIDSVDAVQNDLNHPNRVVYEGDRYDYDFISDISKTSAWGQGVFKYNLFEYFIAGQLSSVNYYRDGKYRNGVFADDSYGKSPTQKFVDYATKAGITYKYNGRHYLFVNAGYINQAPDFEDAYISPRTRNTIADGLQQESITSVEGGYLLKAPKMKARAVFYTTEFKDQLNTTRFYHEDFRTFVNYTINHIDKRNAGMELAFETEIAYGISVSAVASLSRFIFTSNPTATVTQDNKDTLLAYNEPVYIRNFHVGGTPEKAYTFGLSYHGKKFWFLNLDFNYFDGMYISANPARRTSAAVDLIDPDSEQYSRIVDQEKADGQFTMDFSGGKSWKLNDRFKSLKQNTFIILNVGITNLLNNKKFVNGGYEQLRYDYADKNPDKFASKYYYSYGTTFFASLTLRFN
jgi:hypothetical protein